MTTSKKAPPRPQRRLEQCDWCGEVGEVESLGGIFVVCVNCICDAGDTVEANVAPLGASPSDSNTQFVRGTLMKGWRPGADLLLDIDGQRTYFDARRVYNVYRVGVQ